MDATSLETLLPRFETMIREYGVEPSVAFSLWRPILAERIRKHDVDHTIEMQKKILLQGLTGGNASGEMEDVKPSSQATVNPDVKKEVSPPKADSEEQKEDVDDHSESQLTDEYVFPIVCD